MINTLDEQMLESVWAGDLEAAGSLLDLGANINATRQRAEDGVRINALQLAIGKRNKAMCLMLLNRGIDIHKYEVGYKYDFPNILGSLAWDLDLTKIAIGLGADPYDVCNSEVNLLQRAFIAKNESVFRFYVGLGLEILPDRLMTNPPKIPGDYVGSLVHTAAKNLEPQMLQLMLELGARPDVTISFGMTALHDTCNRYSPIFVENAEQKFRAIIRLLLDAGLYIDQRDRQGNTALHYAVGHCPYAMGHLALPEFVTALLEAGADPTVRNKAGQKPADVTNDEMIELMRSFGADETVNLDEHFI